MKNPMKYLAFGVSLAGLCCQLQAEETAFEGQAIGSIPVTGSGRSTIVAVAFKELSSDETQNVSVSNILSTVNLLDGDKVFVYSKSSSTYDSWVLSDGKWTKPSQTVVLDQNGQETSGSGTEASSVRPALGEGFWLIREQTSGGDRDYSQPFYLFGAAVDLASSTATAGAKSLMANPNMTATSPTISDMADGDSVQIPVYSSGKYVLRTYRYQKSDGLWHWTTGWTAESGASIPEISPGIGFWYVSKGSANVTFTW